MLRVYALLACVSASLVVAGCDSCSNKPSAGAAESGAVATTSSSSPSSSTSAVVQPLGKMAHCPNEVVGATTVINDIENGVELLITGPDDATAADIRARAKVLADAAKNRDVSGQHTGQQTGGGSTGRCPILSRNTNITLADVPKGTKVTVLTTVPDQLDYLRRETRQRQAQLKVPGSEGAGRGKMSHCPSAVIGSTTKVVNTKDGVQITVTAKDDDAVVAIRDRAKHIVEVAKEIDGGGHDHTGDGSGGGGLGRCPVIVGDTTVDAKDVDHGSQFVVKPKDKNDLAKIQKEAADRAANFPADAGAPGK